MGSDVKLNRYLWHSLNPQTLTKQGGLLIRACPKTMQIEFAAWSIPLCGGCFAVGHFQVDGFGDSGIRATDTGIVLPKVEFPG